MKSLRAANALLRYNATTSGAIPRSTFLAIAATSPSPLNLTPRTFTTSSSLQKKDRSRGATPEEPKSRKGSKGSSLPAESSSPAEFDPFDFTDLTTAFDKHESRFLTTLASIRTDGGFNTETINTLPIQPDRKNPQTFPLRELAAVASSGPRRFTILAFDESSVKPILSAIQASDQFNQQPQRSEENPLELTLVMEPVRAEELMRRAKEACQAWKDKLREETHKRGETHKKWKGEKKISGDDLVRLKEKMQKLQDERMKAIAGKEKQVLAAIAAKR